MYFFKLMALFLLVYIYNLVLFQATALMHHLSHFNSSFALSSTLPSQFSCLYQHLYIQFKGFSEQCVVMFVCTVCMHVCSQPFLAVRWRGEREHHRRWQWILKKEEWTDAVGKTWQFIYRMCILRERGDKTKCDWKMFSRKCRVRTEVMRIKNIQHDITDL